MQDVDQYQVFFSVVIPVFNGQQTIERSINSVIKQSYSNIELIIIDDGSTDDTRSVVENLSNKTNLPIKYFYQENSRQGAARNNGVSKSSGEYIVFLDSDDELNEGLLLILNQNIHGNTKDDIVFFGYERANYLGETKESFPANPDISKALNNDEGAKYYVPATPCAHVAKKSFLDEYNIKFLENVFFEDIDYMFSIVSFASSSSSIDYIGYKYYIYDESTVRGGKADRNLDVIQSFKSIFSKLNSTSTLKKHHQYIEYHVVIYLLIDANIRVFTSRSSKNEKKKVFEEIKTYVENQVPNYRKNPLLKKMPIKKRLIFHLINFNLFNTLNLILSHVG